MNRRFLRSLPALAATGLLIAGCATGPKSDVFDGSDQSGLPYDPNKPQVLLTGAKVVEAKGIAMGAATSKGWKIARSAPNTLVLERPLNAAAAGALPPGSRPAGGKPPVLEVEADFFQRQQGVDVVLTATAVTRNGAREAQREDYTEPYREALTHSLDSLRAAWEDNRQRIASATPPVSKPDTVPVDPKAPFAPEPGGSARVADAPAPAEPEAGTGADTGWGAAVASPAATAPPAASPVAKAPPPVSPVATSPPAATPLAPAPVGPSRLAASPPAGAPVVARPVTGAPATARAAAAPSDGGAPVVSLPLGPTPTAALPPLALPPSGSAVPEPQEPVDRASNMLVLNQPTTSGGWAYYAEHYARVRGCALTDEGAVLVEKKPEYEVHRVNCEGGQSFLVRCNAGTCRGML